MSGSDKCAVIERPADLDKTLQSFERVFVLFYATWCFYSMRFLPEFLKSAGTCEEPHARMAIDAVPEIVDRYDIQVYPTVLYFENGKLAQRLDGIAARGLSKDQLRSFVEVCSRKA